MKHSAQAVSFSALLAAATAASLLLSGCGSGGSKNAPVSGAPSLTSASRAKGEVSFTVKWPAPSRLIPVASNSIKITLTRVDASGNPSGAGVTPQTLARPAAGQPLTVTATFTGLLPGNYVALAQAFPTATGTGTAQASGPGATALGSASVPVFVKGGVNPPLAITMGTTVTALAVSPQNGPFLRAGDTRVFTATATDVDGNVVLVNQSIVFTLNTSGPFKLVQNGATATLTYTGGPLTGNLSATVTATDTESGKSSTATATFVVAGPVDPIATWGKFHANAQNTGQAGYPVGGFHNVGSNPTTAPGFPSSALAQIEFSSPAIALDGTIYVGANDGNLYAFAPGGGSTPKWKFPTGNFVESSPAIGRDGAIYFGSLDGSVYAVRDNGTSATQIWQTATDGPVFGGPTIDNNGFLYIASNTPGHTLYKMDALSGQIIWSFSTPADGMQGTPALSVNENTVYIGSFDNNVYAVNTSDGSQKWAFPTGGFVQASPAVARVTYPATSGGLVETVFIGSFDGNLYALDGNTGGLIYSYSAGAPIYTAPAIARNPTQGDALAVYFATFDSGGVVGNQVIGLSATGISLPTGGFAGSPENVYFSQSYPAGFTSSPAVTPDGTLLYIGSYDGNVYSIGTDTGNAVGVYATPPPANQNLPEQFDSSPGIAPDGTIYIGGYSGNLYGIR